MKKIIFAVCIAVCFTGISYMAFTSTAGAPTGNTNAPGNGNCTGCHGGALVTSGTVWNNLSLSTTTSLGALQPNTTYTMSLTHTDGSSSKYGFQLMALPSSAGTTTASIGTLISTNNQTQVQNAGSRSYLNHTSLGTSVSGGSKTWNFNYTTPSSFFGNVTFHVTVNSSNSNNSSSGDVIYYKSFSGTVLPVSWMYVKTNRITHNQILIEWATAQEINNSHFTIEKSNNMHDWQNVGVVNGNGNKSTKSLYSFKDHEAQLSECYYRIRQTDFDGTSHYSSIVNASAFGPNETGEPVIIHSAHSIRIVCTDTQNSVQVQIQNMAGGTVAEYNTSAGTEIPLTGVPAGIYVVSAKQNGISFYKKILVP